MEQKLDIDSFGCQYSQNYFLNLSQLTTCYAGGLSAEHRKLLVDKLSDLVAEKDSIIIGTLISDSLDRSCAIKNFVEGKFDSKYPVKALSSMFVEDDTSRLDVEFSGHFTAPPSGMIICARGRLSKGKFKIEHQFIPSPAPQRPTISQRGPLLAAISGFDINSSIKAYYLFAAAIKQLAIPNVIIFGPLSTLKSKELAVKSLASAEVLLHSLVAITNIYLVPTLADCTSRCYPLLPMNERLFPSLKGSCRVHYERNPSTATIGGKSVLLLGAGILAPGTTTLDSVKNSLIYRQLSPKIPNTLAARPAKAESVLFLKEKPHFVICADDRADSVIFDHVASQNVTIAVLPSFMESRRLAIIDADGSTTSLDIA